MLGKAPFRCWPRPRLHFRRSLREIFFFHSESVASCFKTHCLPNVNISTTFGRWHDQHSQKIVLLPIASKFGPQEVNRFSQLCAKFQALGSFELHATIFSNLVKMALPSGRILSRLLRRMKACIDEFRPNTSQANYFGGFWSITSEINAKIEVVKK